MALNNLNFKKLSTKQVFSQKPISINYTPNSPLSSNNPQSKQQAKQSLKL